MSDINLFQCVDCHNIQIDPKSCEVCQCREWNCISKQVEDKIGKAMANNNVFAIPKLIAAAYGMNRRTALIFVGQTIRKSIWRK